MLRLENKEADNNKQTETSRHFKLTMEQPKSRRLILFPFPLQGHINPMLELATILHSKGFSITIIHTNFNSLKLSPSNHPHFTFHSISDNLSESEAAEKDILVLISCLNKKCGEPFCKCLTNLLSSETQESVACLICDPLFDFTQSVSESLKVPRIMLRTGGATSTSVYCAFPLLQEKGYIPIQESRLEETVTELSPVKVKDVPIIHSSDAEGFCKVARALTYDVKFSNGYIFNTFEDLEHNALTKIHKELQIPIFPIGPFHKYFPSSSLLSQSHISCISWLDTQLPKSVIYVSFGSLAAVSKAQFLDIAWGLANSKQPFLWVVRHGLVQGSEWLEPLPSGFLESLNGRGHIVKWAPQKEVLAHQAVGAFWTHNGWNSTLESICEGVPMICTPFFSDQMVNARYASDVWKVGMQLEVGSIKREEIERATRRLMLEKEGEEIRDRVSKLTAVVSAFPHLQEKGYIPRLDSHLEEQVAEFSPLRVKNLPLINSSDKDRFFKLVYNLNYQTKTSCGFILNTFEDLEQNALAKLREEFHIPVFAIGPFHKCVPATSSLVSQDHQSCISWLNSNAQRSVIYVSFGSIVTLDQEQFLEIAWGLSNSKQPFLWVVRPGLVHGSSWLEHLPRGFLEALNGRGHIVKWAPQKEVVAHQSVGVFWTHCGWNSTLEGICEGVPMICTSFYGDQMLNARYACDVWGAGLQLKMERGEIARGIESLMMKQGEQMKDRLSKLKGKANLCFRQGGSSYQALNDLVDHILSLETLATSHKNE